MKRCPFGGSCLLCAYVQPSDQQSEKPTEMRRHRAGISEKVTFQNKAKNLTVKHFCKKKRKKSEKLAETHRPTWCHTVVVTPAIVLLNRSLSAFLLVSCHLNDSLSSVTKCSSTKSLRDTWREINSLTVLLQMIHAP